MRGRCPKCHGTGCPGCKDGYVEWVFPEGPVFTRVCLNRDCWFENGIVIMANGMRGGPNGEPLKLSGACVKCGSATRWKKVGEMLEERILPGNS